jgi:hypothetical protein
MEGLYKKVLKGAYAKIPIEYTDELSQILRRLICVKHTHRPSCDKILGMESVQNWAKKLDIDLGADLASNFNSNSTVEGPIDLLSTIRLPKNLGLLNDRLPKHKYDHSDSLKSLPKKIMEGSDEDEIIPPLKKKRTGGHVVSNSTNIQVSEAVQAV